MARLSKTSRVRWLALVLALPVALSIGCDPVVQYPPPPPPPPFVLARSSLSITAREADTAHIDDTPAYRSIRANVKTVALAAPTTCATQTAAQVSGQGQSSGPPQLFTECGVQMAEIERALSRRGYQVISWRTMAQYSNQLPVQVAQNLGAQVLFQINSLELQKNAIGRLDVKLLREYYRSDQFGTRYDAIGLLPQDVSQIDALIAPYEQQVRETQLPGATLDLSAIEVKSAQGIWFYRWSRVIGWNEEHSASILLRGEPYVVRYDPTLRLQPGTTALWWRHVTPQQKPAVAGSVDSAGAPVRNGSPPLITGSATTISQGVGSADPIKQDQFQAFVDIIDDFVQHFFDGTGARAKPN